MLSSEGDHFSTAMSDPNMRNILGSGVMSGRLRNINKEMDSSTQSKFKKRMKTS